jgi:hypothetical protein
VRATNAARALFVSAIFHKSTTIKIMTKFILRTVQVIVALILVIIGAVVVHVLGLKYDVKAKMNEPKKSEWVRSQDIPKPVLAVFNILFPNEHDVAFQLLKTLKQFKGEKTVLVPIDNLISSAFLAADYQAAEIYEQFLNRVYMGSPCKKEITGIGEASKFYFEKEVPDLTLSEGIKLFAIIWAPSMYFPEYRPESAEKFKERIMVELKAYGDDAKGSMEVSYSCD